MVESDGDYYGNYGDSRRPYRYNPDEFAVDDGRWDDVFDGHRQGRTRPMSSLIRMWQMYNLKKFIGNAMALKMARNPSPKSTWTRVR